MSVQESLIGRTLRDGEYLVREVLGRGGMATVYRAYSRSLETDVALKVLAPSMAVNLELRERFHQEARLLSRLFHPNLLTVHYFGEEGETVYIAMRLVTGGTLRDRLNALGGRLDLVSAARLVHGVADALQAAHDAQVVHLDVKPSNVLLGRADWPLLADTGIAEVIEPATSSGKRRIAGTPSYMSPEQCRGDAVDGRTDQYSLAVMAYELLTGQVPFTAPTTDELMRRQIEDAPPRPRELNPGLPSPVEDILLRGLSKDPAERFPTIGEFGRALADAAERTRGMSLETKTNLADAAPNIVGVLALLALGPLLLLTLPAGVLLGGTLPLAWPFQLALALGLAALALGVRWNVIGLFVRAANALVDTAERASAGSAGTRPRFDGLRRAVVGSAEGVVNLLYVLGLYRLVGTPLLGLLSGVVDPTALRVVNLALLGVVTVLALAIIVGISRTAGFRAALVVLGVAWAVTAVLSTADLGLGGATGVLSGLRLLVGAAIVGVIVVRRQQTAEFVGTLTSAAVARLMLESRQDRTPEQVAADRTRMAALAIAVLDLLYLLLAYAVLRNPLVEELQLVLPPLVAAAVVTAVAGLIWVVLLVRMQVLAGGAGVLLALLLGAPLLLSLPILDGRVVRDVPTVTASAVAWVIAVALLLLLIGIRGRLNDLGRPALGARLDRGLLGTHAADDELAQQRRQRAFGRIVGALIDVALLVLAYWIIGAPIASALVRTTGQTWISTAAIAVLLAAVVSVLGVAVLQTRRALSETGGPAWRARATALAVLCLLLLPLGVVAGATAPAVLASPAGAGALELLPPHTNTVVVDRDFWLPWTPGQDQATYELVLSCSDGTSIGDFRQTIQPAAGATMPAGGVGTVGPTTVPCDNWSSVYAARRQAAGIGDAPSLSWDAMDIHATLNPDDSVDVVETHRVTFTSGSTDHLEVKVGATAADLTNLHVFEGDLQYAIDPAAPEPPNYARDREDEPTHQYWVDWWFPPVSSPSQHTYTIAYHLNGAIQTATSAPGANGTSANGTSAKALAWRVLPPDPLEPIWLATLELQLPDGTPADAIALQASGAPVQSGVLGGRSAWFTAAGPIAAQPLDATVNFSSDSLAFSPPVTPTPPPTPTATPSPTPAPSVTPSVTPAAQTVTPSVTPTDDVTPEATDVTQSVTPTEDATQLPFRPTPSPAPTVTPEPQPSDAPETPTVEATPPPADTPTPVPDTPTAESTPTSAPVATDTPPPTDVPPTPTLAAATPSPTAADASPTATPTLDLPTSTPSRTPAPTATWTPTTEPTPTPTPTSPPPTPTPTPPPPTPTPTPTSPPPTSTPTPTSTVLPVVILRIVVSPQNPTLFLNNVQQMSATGFFSDGSQRDVTGSAKWASSDPKTVPVTSGGSASCALLGHATITATAGNAQGSSTITCTSQIG